MEDGENIHVLAGRLDVEGMRELAYGCQAELVIDATHPFAMEVTKNIQKMCQEESISYMRGAAGRIRERRQCSEGKEHSGGGGLSER